MAQSKGEGGIKFLGFADSSLSAGVTYREKPFRLLHLSARSGRRVKRESRFATRGQRLVCNSATTFSKIPCIITCLYSMYSASCAGYALPRLQAQERTRTYITYIYVHPHSCIPPPFPAVVLVNVLADVAAPNLLAKLDSRLKRYYSSYVNIMISNFQIQKNVAIPLMLVSPFHIFFRYKRTIKRCFAASREGTLKYLYHNVQNFLLQFACFAIHRSLKSERKLNFETYDFIPTAI